MTQPLSGAVSWPACTSLAFLDTSKANETLGKRRRARKTHVRLGGSLLREHRVKHA